MNLTRFMTGAVAALIPLFASAEVAILCGDQKKIEANEAAAAIHLDIFDREIHSVDDVKFFMNFGKDVAVTSVKTNAGRLLFTTKNQSYYFDKLPSCDGEELFSVTLLNKSRMNCLCWED